VKDERFFEIASDELNAGKIRPGLRAKAFSDANGEESRAQALYLKYRVAQLAQEEQEERRVISNAEAQRKKEERAAGEISRRARTQAEEFAREARAKAEGLTTVHYILIGLLTLVFSLIIWKLL
jgi:hypothetical protein